MNPKPFVLIGVLAFAFFTDTAVIPDAWLRVAERVTLQIAALVAVWVLWRSLVKKDQIIISAMKSTTQALDTASSSNQELRKIIEESVESKQRLTVAIDQLGQSIAVLPCVPQTADKPAANDRPAAVPLRRA